ncbi:MAG: SRPBCC family protein [Pseudomonadota bacterium]|jgi:hypothetical protein
MSDTYAYERSHDILIDAPAAAVLDYVSNPQSWPEWIAASHHIDSPNRPLQKGETFHEKWHTRTGEVSLDWVVLDRVQPRLWKATANTDFIGPIVCTYTCEDVAGATRFIRTIANPQRKKPPTDDQIRRIDEEAALALANIKKNVEALKIARAV